MTDKMNNTRFMGEPLSELATSTDIVPIEPVGTPTGPTLAERSTPEYAEAWRVKNQRDQDEYRQEAIKFIAKQILEERIEKSAAFNRTDFGNAERFVEQHFGMVRYCTLWSKWLLWDGQRWRIDDTDGVVRLAKQTIRNIYNEAAKGADEDTRKAIAQHALRSESEHKILAMLKLAESEPGIPITPSQLDANPYLFNCANGTINLRTGELQPHRQEDLLTKLSPVVYEPDAQLELWDSFITWVTKGNDAFARYLQLAVGYSLTGDTREEKLFMPIGHTNTGKSTLAEAIKATLGDYAKTADFESFLKRPMVGGIRNDIADLAGARFVVGIEVDEGKHLAEGLIKMITGGDTVKARHLYSEGFEFLPQFKLWLAANHAPDVNSDDDAMWRRIIKLPFENIVPKERRDPNVKAMLRDPFVGGPAILAWAVQGCLAWQAEGLHEPEVVTWATEAYRDEQDPIVEFLNEKCTLTEGASISRSELRVAYETWCKGQGEMPVSSKKFAALLRARGCGEISGHFRRWANIGLVAET